MGHVCPSGLRFPIPAANVSQGLSGIGDFMLHFGNSDQGCEFVVVTRCIKKPYPHHLTGHY